MPVITLSALRGSPVVSDDLPQALAKAAAAALGLPESAMCVRVLACDPAAFAPPPDRGAGYVFVECWLYPGRPRPLKERLFDAVATVLADAGGRAEDIDLVFCEIPAENWILGGGGAPRAGAADAPPVTADPPASAPASASR
jgi:phenylpyruvate tautomerase PptA (4-oxalocrotonate tautomerase family)